MKPVSASGCAGCLEERGWQLDRVKGSPHVYRHLGGPGGVWTVPVHGNADRSRAPNAAAFTLRRCRYHCSGSRYSRTR